MADSDPSSDAEDGDAERERGREKSAEGRGLSTGGIDLDQLSLESEAVWMDDAFDALDPDPDAPEDAGGADVPDAADGGPGVDGDGGPGHAVGAGRGQAPAVDRRSGSDGSHGAPRPGEPSGDAGQAGEAGEVPIGPTPPLREAPGGAAAGEADEPVRSTRVHDAPGRVVAPVAAGKALTALDPGMRLADRLEKDRIVTAPANRQARTAALATMFLGLLILVLAQRAAVAGGSTDLVGIPAGWLGGVLAAGGLAAWLLLAIYGPRRVLHLHMAPDQQQQWEEVEAQARMTHSASRIGAVAAAAGLLLAAIAFAAAPAALLLGAVALGVAVTLVGLVLLGFAYARRGPLRLLYVQTLVLARLEVSGVGREVSSDPRTAEVLMALDALLGELPESSVRRFLSQKEAEWYLEMVARIREGEHG